MTPSDMYGYIKLSYTVVSLLFATASQGRPMMIQTRLTSLITLCAILMISLFSPRLPDSAEQWLSTLLLGSLVVVCLMVGSGCRRFIRD
jgi:hypothetical protein